MLTKLGLARQLVQSNEREARAACARFTWISSDLISMLSADKHSLVREALASNPKTPMEILRGFENDVAPHVREAAQKNITSQTTGEGVEISTVPPAAAEPWVPIGMPEEQTQLFLLTLNGNLSEQEAGRLLTRGNDWVRAYVAYPNFAFSGRITEPAEFTFSESILDRLLRDKSGLVRAALARNPYIPESFYEVLATDEDRRVQEMLCQNPKTPIEILERLAASGNWRLLELITRNESVPLK